MRAFIEPEGDERVIDCRRRHRRLCVRRRTARERGRRRRRRPRVLAVGREQAPPSSRTSTFVEADATSLPFEDGSSTSPPPCARSITCRGRSSSSPSSCASSAIAASCSSSTRSRRPIRSLGFELDRSSGRGTRRIRACCPMSTSVRCSMRTGSSSRRSEHASGSPRRRRISRSRRVRGRGARRALAVAPESYTATIGWYLAAPAVDD